MAYVVVVDDNELNLELARDVLEIDGHEVEIANSGEDGVTLVCSRPPDLVLMDLRMPGISGLEALQQIHAAGLTELPIVVLTASAMKGEKERLLASGFDGYMQKPIDPASFCQEALGFVKS